MSVRLSLTSITATAPIRSDNSSLVNESVVSEGSSIENDEFSGTTSGYKIAAGTKQHYFPHMQQYSCRGMQKPLPIQLVTESDHLIRVSCSKTQSETDEYFTRGHQSTEHNPHEAPCYEFSDHDDDNSTMATESMSVGLPPISQVHIPFASAAHAGMVELASEDWKTMYNRSRREIEKVESYAKTVMDENRQLKRQLIQLQKQVYETRRTLSSTNSLSQPWRIPDDRSSKRQRASAVEE
jgi:hypothetical protein